ncbi:MAG: aggregation-promoting factor C-terminal-like domain-containing protein [Candidatus Aquicultorales bacterium]
MRGSWSQRIIAGSLVTFVTLAPSAALADKGSDLQAEMDASNAKIEQTKGDLTQRKAAQDELVANIMQVENRLSELSKQVDALRGQLEQVTAERIQAENKLQETTSAIAQARQELEAAKRELARSKEILNNRVRHLYKKGTTSFFAVILNSDDFGDFINRAYFMAMIAAQDARLVAEVKIAEANVAAKKDRLESDRQLAESTREAIAADERRIAQIEADEAAQFAAVEGEKSQKQAMVDSLRNEQATMMAMVQQEQANVGSLNQQLNQWREAEAARLEAARAQEGQAGEALSSRADARPSGSLSGNAWEAIQQESARQGISPGPVQEIVMRESGGDPYAVNPSSGAAGLFQRLPGDHIVLGDVQGQVQDGVTYIRLRYGTSEAALAWWNTFGWY